MSHRPLVTLIVPGFDVAPYAPEALTSLQAQTLTNWVAILVDDASSDATGAIFERAAAADSRFRVVRLSRRGGLGAARNIGLGHVETPYVGFLDADDVLMPGALARLVGMLEASGSDFVLGAYVRLRPNADGGYSAGEVQPWITAATAPERIGTTIDAHPEASANIVAWSKVSRHDFWVRHGLRFPEGKLYEDQIVAQTMYAHARRFDVVPDVIVQWRVRADGSSITQREAQLDVLRDCLEAMEAGLCVLETTGHALAAQVRVRTILTMDLPRLSQIARDHPSGAYRHALGQFARGMADRAVAARIGLPPEAETALTEARGW
ncbi:glycosyltransferase family 2 protein [Elstera cyanobacteriorum]|uniref:glycosyltransferase family 2 protein n=1 Tax=Elstera cyanobacteriorum TaxID=2022747 RepID=UPI0023562B15|nr:glycosyltransferase family 2 protein [Elstera cyanobacteriorum]MCK6444122.1 glycosyltransferase [Elstera cyanobacteriorum]